MIKPFILTDTVVQLAIGPMTNTPDELKTRKILQETNFSTEVNKSTLNLLEKGTYGEANPSSFNRTRKIKIEIFQRKDTRPFQFTDVYFIIQVLNRKMRQAQSPKKEELYKKPTFSQRMQSQLALIKKVTLMIEGKEPILSIRNVRLFLCISFESNFI